MMDALEGLAASQEVKVVDCRTSLLRWYERRGYTEVKRVPVDREIPRKYLSRTDVEFVYMRRKRV